MKHYPAVYTLQTVGGGVAFQQVQKKRGRKFLDCYKRNFTVAL